MPVFCSGGEPRYRSCYPHHHTRNNNNNHRHNHNLYSHHHYYYYNDHNYVPVQRA